MDIAIKLAYTNVSKMCETWATEEDRIDFSEETDRADRCTICFAAFELKRFLNLCLEDARIIYTSLDTETEADCTIRLLLRPFHENTESYRLAPTVNGVDIVGCGRIGVLYGAYEFLKLQGYRWFAPGKFDEIIPEKQSNLKFPVMEETFTPSMDLGRGFDLEGFVPDGDALWLWMARNRMDFGIPQPSRIRFQQKLGIRLKCGGHVFEEFLHPFRILEDGQTVWEGHRGFYGKSSGKALTPETVFHTQFCMTNPELIAYLGHEIVKKLRGPWRFAERIDLWTFDTYGDVCECENCRSEGNGADLTLYFLSKIREIIDADGAGQRVQIVMCAYDGTCTMEPPTRPVPENLIRAGDLVTYYPIMRCYRHNLDDTTCAENRRYFSLLQGWLSLPQSMPVVMGEYYNVTRFDDLPILFTKRICHEIPMCRELGVRAITYMHLPAVNTALRAVNNLLYSQLSWQSGADAEAILTDYYKKKFGRFAGTMRDVYEKMETAWTDCANLRSWSMKSVLSQLHCWDGKKPAAPLDLDGHYRNTGDLISYCRKSVKLQQQAADSILAIRRKLMAEGDTTRLPVGNDVNHGNIAAMNAYRTDYFRLDEDYRLIRFGALVMELTLRVIEYYDALYNNKSGDNIWTEILKGYEQLTERYSSVGTHSFYDAPCCPDLLSRSQLRIVIERCAACRNE